MPDQDTLIAALRKVNDPELNVNVIDLGLIYSIQSKDGEVDVEMTLTSPACPAGPAMLQSAAMEAIRAARYQPYRLNGEPTEVETTITVNFRMGTGT